TKALTKVNLDVPRGDISVVLGANGAGKSTLLKTLAGAITPGEGTIHFEGQDITPENSYQRVCKGIALVPEARRILVTMTIEENLLLGAHHRKDHAQVESEIQKIYKRFPNLLARKHMLASCLSGGEQQMLAIGRALLAKPKLMMLDEPSLGLSPLLVEQMFSLLQEINQSLGITILLVEQNVFDAMKISKWATVL